MTFFPTLSLNNLRGDVLGGLTAAVVALPVALALGIESGLGPLAGLYSAVLVGFFAALFGGTPGQIAGPTGPMTVVMAIIVTRFADEPAVAFAVVIMGGLFQILIGALKLGRLVELVPYTVVSGFMSGVGIIIAVLQIAPLLGQSVAESGPVNAILAFPSLVQEINLVALAAGSFAFVCMLITPKKISAIIPAPLIALLLGSAAVIILAPGSVPTIGAIPTGFPAFQVPDVTLTRLVDMLGSALVLALLGSIDSLLTSLIADQVTRKTHNPDRELIGQGVGNALAGFFGALPGAGATMFTLSNIRAGGRGALSGMVYAAAMLAVVMGLAPLAEPIPKAVLAGILVKVGLDIIDWPYLKRVLKAPKAGVFIMAGVLILTVGVDLIVAVLAGLVVASLYTMGQMAKLVGSSITAVHEEAEAVEAEDRRMLEAAGSDLSLYVFNGPLSFAMARGMARRFVIPETHKVLVLDLSGVPYVDTTIALTMADILERAGERGLRVVIAGLRPKVEKILGDLGALDKVDQDCRLDTRHQALGKAKELLETTVRV